jgi:hypothetical protein
MENPPKPAAPTNVELTSGAVEALDEIVVMLKNIGFRVKTSALVEAALVELKEQMQDREKAIAIVRKRVPPKSVVLPP